MIRYRTLDLPPVGASAFTPVPAKNPVASSYGLVIVSGAPGTMQVASPDSAAMPDSLTVQQGPNVSAMSHTVTPDYIFPSVYIASARHMGPAEDTGIGMTLRRLCPLPMPAVDPGRHPVPVMMQFPVGANPLPWPRAFQRWRNRGE
jgi:hypothetical protein